MFEAYKIGIRISLLNYASRGLLALSKDFLKTEASAASLEARIASIQKLALKGGLMLGAGMMGLSWLKGPYEAARKLAQARADFETMNLSAHDNARMMAHAATLAHRNLGTTITGNVKAIHDLHTAFGDLPRALRVADAFTKFGFVAQVMNGGTPVEGLVYNAAKALEHRGQKVMGDAAAFTREMGRQMQVDIATKGKVNPNEFFQLSQTGKLAYTLLSEDELYGPVAAYMQAKTGRTAGTALMTFQSSLIGGHMTAKAKGFLADLGLYEEGVSTARLRSISAALGGIQGKDLQAALKGMGIFTPLAGGLKSPYLDLAVHDPSQFVQNVLVPAIRQRYGNLSDEAVATLLMQHFNRNTSDVMGEFLVNALRFKKDAWIFAQSMGIDEAYQHYLKTPDGRGLAAAVAYENFKAVFGMVFLPTITRGLLGLAKALTAMAKFFDQHPHLARAIGWTFVAFFGGLLLQGVKLIFRTIFSSLGLTWAARQFRSMFTRMRPILPWLRSLIGGASRAIPIIGGVITALTALIIGIKAWHNRAVIQKTAVKMWHHYTNWLLKAWDIPKLNVADRYRPSRQEGATHPLSHAGSPFIANAGTLPIQVDNRIYLDGRQLSQAVTLYQSRAAQRAAFASGSQPDGSFGFYLPAQP